MFCYGTTLSARNCWPTSGLSLGPYKTYVTLHRSQEHSCRCFSRCEKVNVRTLIQQRRIFMSWNKLGTFVFRNRISRETGTELIKTHKTPECPGENQDDYDPYLRTTKLSTQKYFIHPTECIAVGSRNKQRLFPCTALTLFCITEMECLLRGRNSVFK